MLQGYMDQNKGRSAEASVEEIQRQKEEIARTRIL